MENNDNLRKDILFPETQKTNTLGNFQINVSDNSEMSDLLKDKQIFIPTAGYRSFQKPLILQWTPQKDITTYELAQCLSYINNYNLFFADVFESDGSLKLELNFLRHFIITNPNI